MWSRMESLNQVASMLKSFIFQLNFKWHFKAMGADCWRGDELCCHNLQNGRICPQTNYNRFNLKLPVPSFKKISSLSNRQNDGYLIGWLLQIQLCFFFYNKSPPEPPRHLFLRINQLKAWVTAQGGSWEEKQMGGGEVEQTQANLIVKLTSN